MADIHGPGEKPQRPVCPDNISSEYDMVIDEIIDGEVARGVKTGAYNSPINNKGSKDYINKQDAFECLKRHLLKPIVQFSPPQKK
jgi:hypothetical protein